MPIADVVNLTEEMTDDVLELTFVVEGCFVVLLLFEIVECASTQGAARVVVAGQFWGFAWS